MSGVCRKRSAGRLQRLLLAQVMCLGRHTLTGLACAAGRQSRDWSYDYRFCQKVAADRVLSRVRELALEQLSPGAPVVVAMDDTILRKKGRNIPGTSWKLDPLSPPFQANLVWAQRWLECSVLLPCGDQGAARAIPLEFLHVPTAQKPGRKGSDEQWKLYREQKRQMNINRRAVAWLAQFKAKLGRDLLLVTDGRFANGTMLKNLPEGVQMVCRVRSDARLSATPKAQESKRRKYGATLPTPDEVRQDSDIPWQRVKVHACGKSHRMKVKVLRNVMWRTAGQKNVFDLIVIAPLSYRLRKGGKLLYRNPGYLLCTRGRSPVRAVVQHYVNRWDIEVNIRDEKQVIGVGEAMLRHPSSAENMPRLAVAAYSLLLLAAHEAYGPEGLATLPLPAWRKAQPPRRASTNSLVNQVRFEMARRQGQGPAAWDFWARDQQALPRTARQAPVLCPNPIESAFCYASA